MLWTLGRSWSAIRVHSRFFPQPRGLFPAILLFVFVAQARLAVAEIDLAAVDVGGLDVRGEIKRVAVGDARRLSRHSLSLGRDVQKGRDDSAVVSPFFATQEIILNSR